MKTEMENIRGEMEEIKERLDTLTALLKENKDAGQLSERLAKINTSLLFSQKGYAIRSCENVCYLFAP